LTPNLFNPYRYAVSTYPDSLGASANSTSVTDIALDTSNQILGSACLEFNGTSSFAVLPNTLDTIFSGDFSFGIWIFVNDVSATNVTVINKPAQSSWISPYHSFTINQNGANFEFATNDGSTYVVLSNATGGLGWHWVLVERKISTNRFYFYVDNDTPVESTITPTFGTQTFMLGNTAYNSRFWSSDLDDTFFATRLLTSAERISIYNSGSGNLASTLDHTGIVAYYNFDDLALNNDAIPVS